MGRIRPTFIKRVGEDLLIKYEGRFKDDFEHNKKAVQEMIDSGLLLTPSKRIRNKLAGYLVRGVRPTHNPIYKAAPEKQKRPRGRGRPIRRQ